MPRVSESFESPYLQPGDLEPGKVTAVTITALLRDGSKRYGETAFPRWALRFAEFEKPMRLNVYNGRTIGGLLGLDEMAEWVGKRIGIFPATVPIDSGELQVINVDLVVPDDLPARVVPEVRPPVRLGRAGADQLLASLVEYGGLDRFLRWARTHDVEAFEACFGRDPEDYPTLLAARAFDGFTAEPMPGDQSTARGGAPVDRVAGAVGSRLKLALDPGDPQPSKRLTEGPFRRQPTLGHSEPRAGAPGEDEGQGPGGEGVAP